MSAAEDYGGSAECSNAYWENQLAYRFQCHWHNVRESIAKPWPDEAIAIDVAWLLAGYGELGEHLPPDRLAALWGRTDRETLGVLAIAGLFP